MIFLDLVSNIALLISLCIVHSLIIRRFRRGTTSYRLLSGLLFGIVAVIGMVNPMHMVPGVIFDGRSIILSLAGLFGGFATAAVSAAMAAAYRIWLGGAGAVMGVSVIVSSAALGVGYCFLRRRHGERTVSPLFLWGFSILVHAVMLALMFTLPGGIRQEALKQLAVPVIVLYPLASLLLSLFFLNQEDKLKAEDKLQKSRENYRNLVQSINSIIMRWRPDGTITFVNDFGLRFFGFEGHEIIGRNLVGSIVPETESTGRDLAGMIRQIAAEPEKFIDNENENICRDGRRVWVRWANAPQRDSDGRLIEIMSAGNDITGRKLAEQALRESEERYRTLFDTMEQGVVYQDAEGRIISANPAAERILGLSLDQMQGRTSMDPRWKAIGEDGAELPGEHHPAMVALETGKPVKSFVEGIFNPVQNEYRWILVDAIPEFVPGHNSPVRVYSSFSDITERRRAEQEIRDSEERYRHLFDHLVSGFALHEIILNDIGEPVDYRFLEVNPAFEKITGLRAEEIVGRTALEAVPGTDGKWIDIYGKVALTGEPAFFEDHHAGLDRYYEVLAYSPRRGQFAVLFNDVTSRRKIQEAIRLSEEKVRSIFRAAPVGIGVSVDRVIREVNTRVCEMLGYRRDELIGKNGRILYPSDEDFEFVGREVYGRIGKHGVGTVETRWVKKDGGVIDVLLSSSPLDPSNISRGVTFTVLDITGRKRDEARLRLLASTVHQAAECVTITDPNGNIQYVNPAFERTTGFGSDEVIGRNPRILKSGSHDSDFYAALWNTITAGNTWSGHLINRRKDGELYHEDATISPVRGENGRIMNYVAVKRDVTKELELEEQLRQSQKMEAIGLLAGGVAHDLNNMLTPILGYAEILLMESGLSETMRGEIQQIVQAGEKARDLIGQLMAFGRKQTLVFKHLDLSRVAADFSTLLRRTLPEDIRLELELSDNLPAVRADRGRIEQVLMNLAVNAQDAMPSGGTLTIETAEVNLDEHYSSHHLSVLPGRYVLVSVSDTGVGMTEEVRNRVFEPFYTTKESGKGSGLGLSTVYGIVKQHGGNIWLYSEPGQGSTFKIYLPAAEKAMAHEEITRTSVGVETGNETILVAEDDPAVRNLVCTMLESLGYRVLSGATLDECMEHALKHGRLIQLLLTDVVMPEISGKEMYKRLGEAIPGLRALYMSGYTANVIVHRGVLEDNVQFIQKPFTRHELAAKVRLSLEE